MAIKSRGFTLIELLVVIAIIGFLASIVLASLSGARGKGRDAKRLADLSSLQTALELYANDHNGYYPSTSLGWWGNCSAYGSHPTSGANGWIPNLTPQYVGTLPLDPNPVGNNGCYLYRSDGTDYILLAYLTVETYTAATNRHPRFLTDGVTPPCPSDVGYQNTFAFSTPGGQCW